MGDHIPNWATARADSFTLPGLDRLRQIVERDLADHDLADPTWLTFGQALSIAAELRRLHGERAVMGEALRELSDAMQAQIRVLLERSPGG